MKRARVIYNPTSGREIFKKNLPEVLVKLEQAGYETSTHATTGAGDAMQAARAACANRFDLVVACGGDGTLREVISGLAEQEYRPKVGLIPVGTTNDFGRALRIPFDIMTAVDIIVNGELKPLDIGKVNDSYFVNIAGGGRITELTYDVPIKMKTILGRLAYYIRGVEMLPTIKPSHVHIEYDGEVYDGEAMMFLISNSNSVGGFEKLAPFASFSDGLFEVLILKKTSVPDLMGVALKVLKGGHLEDPNVIYAQAKRVLVTSNDEVHLNLDGEYGGDTPAEFVVLENHLEIYAPKSPEAFLEETTE